MKTVISQIWDDIEQKLSDGSFWVFVTNKKQDDYATKIELLFDLIAENDKRKDPLFTFLYFLERSRDPKELWKLWINIEQCYLTLCEWYKDKQLYHKIGYLITVSKNSRELKELIDASMSIRKDKFERDLYKKISSHVTYNVDIESLSYERDTDYEKIEKVLLLFNVESIQKTESVTDFYPFKFHKNIQWSLEHIHAQSSESLTKKEQWIEWLHYHAKLIKELIADERDTKKVEEWKIILKEINQINNERLTRDIFRPLSTTITAKFSEESDNQTDWLHSISNLALLSQSDNGALNNSVFEVKRRAMIEMDKNGKYIPLCTRRVFLKYYNNKPSTQQYYFWGEDDRKSYLAEIKTV